LTHTSAVLLVALREAPCASVETGILHRHKCFESVSIDVMFYLHQSKRTKYNV